MTSLRDHFASKAMAALLTGHAGPNDEDAKRIAEQAYRMAMAMIAARRGSESASCIACFDGRRAYRLKLEDGTFGGPIACPHCGLDPNEGVTTVTVNFP